MHTPDYYHERLQHRLRTSDRRLPSGQGVSRQLRSAAERRGLAEIAADEGRLYSRTQFAERLRLQDLLLYIAGERAARNRFLEFFQFQEGHQLYHYLQTLPGTGSLIPLGHGTESLVFFDPHTTRVIKLMGRNEPRRGSWIGQNVGNNEDDFQSSWGQPLGTLERFALFNQELSADVQIEGVIADGPTEATHLLLSQNFVVGREANVLSKVHDYFVQKGYRRIANAAYFHETSRILIRDAVPKNLKETREGEIVPVDLVLRKLKPNEPSPFNHE